MFIIPTGDALVSFIKDFTGSTNDAEIKQCIFMAEMSMRNIELPALRSDPYAPENIGVADAYGRVPIPGDMNKPILFFKQGAQVTTTANATGTAALSTVTLTTVPSRTIVLNMLVTGTGIAPGATVVNIAGAGGIGTVLTLSAANTGTVSGTLTFNTTGTAASQSGPWIVYDRVGDRDIITQGMIAQLYLSPVNVPAVIRGKFSEVYNKYQFLPYIAQGDLINMYYYKAWPLLFAPVTDQVISTTGTVGTIAGSGPFTGTITSMTGVGDLQPGDQITATAGTGSLGTGGVVTVVAILSATSCSITKTGGTIFTAGTVSGVTQTGQIVQNNAVLQTWPEGYVYATMREYYIKRHNDTDAAVYQQKFDAAWNVVNDQNNLGKWSGGHTRLTSVWQPRQYRQYSIK